MDLGQNEIKANQPVSTTRAPTTVFFLLLILRLTRTSYKAD